MLTPTVVAAATSHRPPLGEVTSSRFWRRRRLEPVAEVPGQGWSRRPHHSGMFAVCGL